MEKSIVQLVYDEMERRNLSPRSLGEMSGVHYSQIYRWFKGERAINAEGLERIMETLELMIVRKP